jgi:hypothetical protein
MFVALLTGLVAASPLPSVTVEQTKKGYVAKAATFDLRQQAEVETEIARRAAELCKGKEIRWGEFNSVAKLGKTPGAEPAPVSGYSHEFSCISAQQATYEPAPADWKASAADEADVRAFFASYYTRRDKGDFPAALGMFASDMIGDRVKLAEEMAAFNTKIGSGTRRVTGVTWYVNPRCPSRGLCRRGFRWRVPTDPFLLRLHRALPARHGLL